MDVAGREKFPLTRGDPPVSGGLTLWTLAIAPICVEGRHVPTGDKRYRSPQRSRLFLKPAGSERIFEVRYVIALVRDCCGIKNDLISLRGV